MCSYCFTLLTKTLNSHPLPTEPHALFPANPPDTPLFVTWEIKSKKGGTYKLRGCIGTLSPSPLPQTLTKYCLISSLQDTRFNPISVKELKDGGLKVSVSMLVDFEVCNGCYDWSVGVHGIIITFTSTKPKKEYSSTFLPNVSSEQGWDTKETVRQLILKTGYSGAIDDGLIGRVQCQRYQSSLAGMKYEEWMTEQGGKAVKV